MANSTLNLTASQADWLARAAAQFRLQEAGEGYGFRSHYNVEILEVDAAAALVGDAAEMIIELRQTRTTTRVETAEKLAREASDEIIRYLGHRHMDVLRAEKGAERHDAERDRDRNAAEALLGLEILDGIKGMENGDGEGGDAR